MEPRDRKVLLASVASWFPLGLVLLAAVALHLFGLEHLPGINADEGVYGVHAMAWLEHGAPLSSLRTGTDLPMNPVFFGMVVALHAALGPSLLTLRLAAALHSLFAIALAFALFRRRGPAFALALATLVAILPIHLGYARIAWDAAAIPTVMLVALAAALALRPVWTLLAFVLGLWVHPATVFALPILLAPLVAARLPRDERQRPRLPRVRSLSIAALAVLGILLVVSVLERSDALPTPVLLALRGDMPARIVERASSPTQALQFAQLYAELLAGPTIYRYLAGSLPSGAAHVHLALLALLSGPLLFFGVRRFLREGLWSELALVAGLATSLALTYLVGGAEMLAPHTERYGLFLTVPSCLVAALCIEALSRQARRAALLRAGLALVGLFCLASFGVFALGALQYPNPARANTFRTGDQDPKALALRAIHELRARDRSAVVLAEDWWIYWPVRYLGEREPELRVSIVGAPWDYRFPRDFILPRFEPQRMELFGVAWAGSAVDASFARNAERSVEIRGYEPAPILRVHRLRPPAR